MPEPTLHPLDLLAVYRELNAAERASVDTHLAECATCRATLAAYARQDATLTALPQLRPTRNLTLPAAQPGRWGWALSRLSGAFALAGVAALALFVVLQAQAPGAAAAAPGITLPATNVRLPSPWLPALPWLAASLLVVGALLVLSRRSAKGPVWAAIFCTLLLISFVPPLSAAPNPLAFYWRIVGGYSYDPRLPFKNNFLIAGQPDQQLRPYLAQLIGQRGLTPLDPNQRLVTYEILRVGLHPQHNRVALVTVRFIYEGGTSRIYPVPLARPANELDGFLLGYWALDGLERLRSVHLALAGQPFAQADSPIRLGAAQHLELNPAANRLDEANPTHWMWNSVRLQRLVWAPDGQAFLSAIELDPGRRQLWLVLLDGSPPIPVGPEGDIYEYAFSPDGAQIVYTRVDPEAMAANPTKPFAVMVVDRTPRATPRTLVTALQSERLPGLSPQGAWFVTDDRNVWIAPLDGRTPKLLENAEPGMPRALPPRPAPDGHYVAYACGLELCIQNADDGSLVKLDGPLPSDITWTNDGERLALVLRDVNNVQPVRLRVITRAGETVFEGAIAPRDVTEPPQWTPDGEAVFIQTYPQDGRRILAVDLPSGQVLDLSREHWDAYFALSPDGQRLLLNNGRGDYWTVEVVR